MACMSHLPVTPDAVRAVAAMARPVVCTACGAHAYDECRPPEAMHLGRFMRARDQDLITAGDLDLVLAFLELRGVLSGFYTIAVPLS